MRPMYVTIVFTLFLASPSWATVRYADSTLVSNCTSGNYSITNRNCTGSDGNAYNTFAAVISPTVAGDTIYIRAGTWNQQINLQDAAKSGTSSAYITIAGYPGERPVIQFTDTGSYGPIKVRGNRGWFVFQNLILDGINQSVNSGWQIRDGNHDFILDNLEIKNQFFNGVYLDAVSNVIIRNSVFRDARSDCSSTVTGNRWYGIYAHHGSNVIIENNEIYNMPGGGMQNYPGPWTGLIIRKNNVHENAWCVNTPVGGILTQATSGNITGLQIYKNLSWGNGGTGKGWGAGFTFDTTSPYTVNGSLYNNVSYNNQFGSTGHAWGYNFQGSVTIDARNNIAFGNESGSMTSSASAVLTRTNNACPTAHSSQCGATGFIALTAITDCVASTTTFTQKSGSSCIDAGTNVGLSYNGTAPDIGAFETFVFSSCEVPSDAANTIRVTFTNNVSPPLGDTLTTFTARVNGSSNALTGAASKIGDNIISLPLTTTYIGSNTADISWASGGLTDSSLIGATINQPFVQTLSNQSCTNNVGGVLYTFTQATYLFHGVYGLEASPDVRSIEGVASFPVVKNGAVRLRFALVCGGADCPPSGFYLYYATGGSYAPVPDAYSSDNVAFCGSAYSNGPRPENGAATTDQLSTAGTFTPGGIVFSANAIPTITGFNTNYKTELEYCVRFNSSASGAYTFRVYQQDGTALNTYTLTPTVTMTDPQASGAF